MSSLRILVAARRGAVFIDILTSMAFVLLLLGVAHSWSRTVLYTQKTLEVVAAANQEAVLAGEAIARDVRNAGFHADTDVEPIPAAGPDFLELAADLNGDGDVLDASEIVRYAYRADRQQVTRASGRGSPQPFTDDVPLGGLRFSFFDGDASEIVAGASGIDATDLPRIRRIDIYLAIALRNPDPRVAKPIRAEAETIVALRNP